MSADPLIAVTSMLLVHDELICTSPETPTVAMTKNSTTPNRSTGS